MTILEKPSVPSGVELDDVAKNKGKSVPEPKAKTLFSLKGDQVWYDWLKRYAESLGVPVTTAIDIALRDQAKRDKFDEPMPKRFGR